MQIYIQNYRIEVNDFNGGIKKRIEGVEEEGNYIERLVGLIVLDFWEFIEFELFKREYILFS